MASAAKRRKVKRTTQKNRADRLFSLFIRHRDNMCVRCGKHVDEVPKLQCAHIFSRRYHNVRWDKRNAVALCAGCHVALTHDPIRHEDFFMERLGAEAYAELRSDAIRVGPKTDYDAVIEELVELCREVGVDGRL